MTLPQVEALGKYWLHFPPASMSMARIVRGLGIETPQVPKQAAIAVKSDATAKQAIEQAIAAGIPMFGGRPDDPMLDLLEFPA